MLCIVILTVGCTSSSTENKLPKSKPDDFNFILNYGITAKNQLNTVDGTYTKDMIGEGTLTTNLKLSEEEMNDIYKTMRNIDILSYPGIFTPESNTGQTPFPTYWIRIFYEGKEKRIYWEDEKDSKTKEAVKLRELYKKIHEIVVEKEEYKKLPKPKGGYA